MIPYQKEKVENAVLFFAQQQQKCARKPLYQTYLFKYLAFLDFESLKLTGRPSLGLTYRALEKGPVPIALYNREMEFDSFDFINDEQGKYVKAKKGPDMSYFSNFEIKLMDKLIEIFATRYVYSKHMSDASHEEISAWRKTRRSNPDGIIDFSLTFDGDLHGKSNEELTYPEECYLLQCAFDEPH